MTGVDDLITWLRAQLDEEERRLCELDDVQNYPKAILWRPADENNPAVMSIEVNGLKTYRRYWDPEHSGQPNDWGWNAKNGVELFSMEQIRERLADINAKRRIVDDIVPLIDTMDGKIESEWGVGLGPTGESGKLLKLLALPYADREGYRAEWKP